MRFVLDYILETPNGRRTVSRISRTCKALSDLALNALWKELDSLLPLLSLMPGHLFKKSRRPGQGFNKAPSPEDWTQVLRYGERVMKISYNESAGIIHPNIFSTLAQCKTLILPNLRTIQWKSDSTAGLGRSILFLGPHLRSVSIDIGGGIPPEDLAEYLTAVSSSTRLTSLSITSPSRLPNSLPRLLQQQTTLEKVCLLAPGALSPSIGRWLSSITSLQSLQVDVGDRSDGVIASFFNGLPTSGRSSPGFASPDLVMTPLSTADSTVLVNFSMEPGFKQLRNVSVSGELGSVSSFLARIPAPLESVKLILDEPEDAKEWRALWFVISRQFKNSLRSISISSSSSRSGTRNENVARRLRLDGLENTEHSRLIFPYLTHFEADLVESRIILDQDLQHLATACPNLEVVKLCPITSWPISQGPPKTTLTGVALLTAGCERLHTLHIPIHAFKMDDPSLFEIETSSLSLRTLHLGHSWIGDPMGVAIHLSHFAPYLENLKYFHERNRPGFIEAHCNGWQRVNNILPQLQQLRLHERSQTQSFEIIRRLGPASIPPSPPSYIRLSASPNPLKKCVSRAIQAGPSTTDRGMQTKVNTRNKNISTKPIPSDMHDVMVEARPFAQDQGIDATPRVHDEGIQMRPLSISKLIETIPPPEIITVNVSTSPVREEFEELEVEVPEPAPSGVITRSFALLAQIIRALSPPILLRILNLFSLWSNLALHPLRGNTPGYRAGYQPTPMRRTAVPALLFGPRLNIFFP